MGEMWNRRAVKSKEKYNTNIVHMYTKFKKKLPWYIKKKVIDQLGWFNRRLAGGRGVLTNALQPVLMGEKKNPWFVEFANF